MSEAMLVVGVALLEVALRSVMVIIRKPDAEAAEAGQRGQIGHFLRGGRLLRRRRGRKSLVLSWKPSRRRRRGVVAPPKPVLLLLQGSGLREGWWLI